MNNDKKLELFKEMQKLEEAASAPTYDGRNYFEQAEGFYKALKILGIEKEYIKYDRENK